MKRQGGQPGVYTGYPDMVFLSHTKIAALYKRARDMNLIAADQPITDDWQVQAVILHNAELISLTRRGEK